jgi:hypothetical protein
MDKKGSLAFLFYHTIEKRGDAYQTGALMKGG